MEMKAKKNTKSAAAPQTLQDRINNAFNPADAGAETSGAAEAVGVLNAVDEDGEGAEEADVPREFEYDTEGGED